MTGSSFRGCQALEERGSVLALAGVDCMQDFEGCRMPKASGRGESEAACFPQLPGKRPLFFLQRSVS